MEFWELVEVVSILGSVIERLLKTIDYTREETKGNPEQGRKKGRKEIQTKVVFSKLLDRLVRLEVRAVEA